MQINILKQTYDNQHQFYHAHLQQPLIKGCRYVLSMKFTGYLNDKLRGFYRSSYSDSNGIKRYVSMELIDWCNKNRKETVGTQGISEHTISSMLHLMIIVH